MRRSITVRSGFPPGQESAREFGNTGDDERDADAQSHPEQRLVFEDHTTEEADARGIQGPGQTPCRVEDEESAARILQDPGGDGCGRATTGNEASGDEDDPTSAGTNLLGTKESRPAMTKMRRYTHGDCSVAARMSRAMSILPHAIDRQKRSERGEEQSRTQKSRR